MQLILKSNIHNLGVIGDVVNVKAGYGRNFLLPQGLALPATPENIKEFEKMRAELEKKAAAEKAAAQKRADAIAKLDITIQVLVGEEGKLFGSVGTKDIADAITAAGQEIHKNEILLPNGPLREVGEFDVALLVHGEVDASVKVKIVPQE